MRELKLAEKPFFRQAFKRNRCLIPVSGYYEWQDTPRHGACLRTIAVFSLVAKRSRTFSRLSTLVIPPCGLRYRSLSRRGHLLDFRKTISERFPVAKPQYLIFGARVVSHFSVFSRGNRHIVV
jgi:hypothetical protein